MNKINKQNYYKKQKNFPYLKSKKKNEFINFKHRNVDRSIYLKSKKKNYFTYLKIQEEKNKIKKLQITKYLYRNKKLKKGIFLKEPSLNDIKYPIKFNFKLINEFLKKK
jgi:hypothetical protein